MTPDDKYTIEKYGITEEQLQKIKKSWEEYGDCRSCGWHSAFFEVEENILPDILDEKNWEPDGSYWVPCYNYSYPDEDHRGCNLYDFK